MKKMRKKSKKIIYEKMPKSMRWHSTVNKVVVCPVCNCLVETDGQKLSCRCKSEEFKNWPDNNYDGDNTLLENGISISRNNTLSLYSISYDRYAQNPKDAEESAPDGYQKVNIVNILKVVRASVNLDTRAEYYSGPIGRGKYGFQRTDWSQFRLNFPWQMPFDMIEKFINMAFEKCNIPVSVKYVKWRDEGKAAVKNLSVLDGDGFIFTCGEDSMFIPDKMIPLTFCFNILASPNYSISYDPVTGKMGFKTGSEKFRNCNVYYVYDLNKKGYPTKKARKILTCPIFKSATFKQSQPHDLIGEDEYIDLMIKKCSLPSSEKAIKLYKESPAHMAFMSFIVEDLKVTKLKNQLALFKLLDKLRCTSYSSDLIEIKRFLRAMIKENGEDGTVKRLSEAVKADDFYSSSFYNLVHYWNCLKKAKRPLPSLAGSLQDTRDVLVKLYDEYDEENKPIRCTEREKALEGTVNGFTFSLMRDTRTLCELSRNLNYHSFINKNECLSKEKSVFAVTDKKGRYKAGIILHRGGVVGIDGVQGTNKGIVSGIERTVAGAILTWIHDNKVRHFRGGDYETVNKIVNHPEIFRASKRESFNF